jgi:hypothetical protein
LLDLLALAGLFRSCASLVSAYGGFLTVFAVGMTSTNKQNMTRRHTRAAESYSDVVLRLVDIEGKEADRACRLGLSLCGFSHLRGDTPRWR